MELAPTQTGVCRAIGKVVVLGLLVILVAKTIVIVLALAVAGALLFACVRALHLRRASLRRILLGTKEVIVSTMAALGIFLAMLITAVGWLLFCASWMAFRFSLRTCSLLWRFGTALILVLLSLSLHGGKILRALARFPVRSCVSVTRVMGASLGKIRSQSAVLCGIVVEAASGALLCALLLNLTSLQGIIFLPELERVAARVCAAALFGAFLGIMLGLSRITWRREEEISPCVENQQ